MSTLKDRLSIILSLLAFTISAFSFYLTTLRAVDPEIRAGSSLYVFHDVFGTASVAMSVNVTNTGGRLAVVERLRLLIHRPDSSAGYVLAPTAYIKFNDKGEPQEESMEGVLTVQGRSEATKQILFKASAEEDDFSIASPGRYACTLVAWLASRSSPLVADTFSIELSEVDAAQLGHRRDLQVTNAVAVERIGGKEWRPGRVEDVQSLLKSTKPWT